MLKVLHWAAQCKQRQASLEVKRLRQAQTVQFNHFIW